jgi:hypothetical protein
MERFNKYLAKNTPAVVIMNPSTQDASISMIKDMYFTSSGAWFNSDTNPSRGTPIKAYFLLKYGPEQRNIRISHYGTVVSSGPEGFAVKLDL